MFYKEQMKLCLTPYKAIFLGITILLVVWLIIRIMDYHKTDAIDMPKDKLLFIQGTGMFKGEGTYGPTKHYPNGLKAKLRSTRQATSSGLDIITEVTAYDAKTGEHVYDAIRYVTFSHKPNKGNRLYKSSKSYIDDKLVSSSNGWVTMFDDKSMESVSKGSWHISAEDHEIISRTETNGSKMRTTFTNNTRHPLKSNHFMEETYEKVSE